MTDTQHKNNFILHFREIPFWLRSEPITFHLIAEFARRTSRTERDVNWQGEIIHIKPGQFITGRISTAQKLGISEGQYRGAFKRLLKSKHIQTVKVTKRYTICLFSSDNPFYIYLDTASPSEKPSDSPSVHQPSTTNDNGNTVDIDNRDNISQVKIEESHTRKKKEEESASNSQVSTRNSGIESVGEIVARKEILRG